MDKCADLLPDYLRFVKGVVDTPDVSLNISREMLQQTRELKVIAKNLDKKVRGALEKMLKDDREKYEKFWKAFGTQLKYGVVSNYGMDKDSPEGPAALRLLRRREGHHPEGVCGPDARGPAVYLLRLRRGRRKLAKLPQAERILDAGYEILFLTEDVDEFCMQVLGTYSEKQIKSINAEDALPETEEEKKAAQEKAEAGKAVLDFLKETLGDKIKEARISKILKSHPVCMVADGPMSLEMEKYLKKQNADMEGLRAERVLEVNPDAPVFAALQQAMESDPEKARKYAELLYCQALLIADLPLEDPSAYTDLVCSLMV